MTDSSTKITILNEIVTATTGDLEASFPLQVIVYLLKSDHDANALIAGYRQHDPLPDDDECYPGTAYLGAPSGEVLQLPPGWSTDGQAVVHGDFRAVRDGEAIAVGWPGEMQKIPIAWARDTLGIQAPPRHA